jgi:hypothetical protein
MPSGPDRFQPGAARSPLASVADTGPVLAPGLNGAMGAALCEPGRKSGAVPVMQTVGRCHGPIGLAFPLVADRAKMFVDAKHDQDEFSHDAREDDANNDAGD